MSTDEEMQVIGRTVTEYAEVKRRVAALEELARQHGGEMMRIGKALNNVRLGPLEIDLAAMPTREAVERVLAELREARERHAHLLASLQKLGIGG
jgi:hypothetical protein